MPGERMDDEAPKSAKPEVSGDFLELLELRLSESISTRVRTSLFKWYAVIGAVVGAVLTYAGIDVIGRINDAATDRAQKMIEEQIKPTIDEAEQQAQNATVQLKVIEELNKNGRAAIEKLNARLEELEPQAEKLQQAADAIAALEVQRRDLEAGLSGVNQSITSLQELGDKVAALATQVSALSDIVSSLQLNQKSSTDVKVIGDALQALAEQSQQVTQQVATIRDQTRVFFQFYGMPGDTAQELSQHLRTAGYIVPGAERVAMNSAGLSQIRFFWPEDASRAENLRADVEKALNDAGIVARPVTVVPRTDWAKEKPRRGTVELWIGLPAAAE
ncbi:MAG TPA: hypothetical protein VG742_16835 [Dongiaceae bacterium]|nr:hypothetical protein [Dongiaceae bacterium]